jgi:hypothetical protein
VRKSGATVRQTARAARKTARAARQDAPGDDLAGESRGRRLSPAPGGLLGHELDGRKTVNAPRKRMLAKAADERPVPGARLEHSEGLPIADQLRHPIQAAAHQRGRGIEAAPQLVR